MPYLLRRLVWAAAVVAAVAVLTFLLTYIAPGDPAKAIAGAHAPAEAVERIRTALGLDRSPLEQLLGYFGRLLQGDFGHSYKLNGDVLELILAKLPATIELAVAGLLVSIAIGVPLGVAGARRPGSLADRIGAVFSSIAVSMPGFLLGLVLLYLLAFLPALQWGIDLLPIGGRKGLDPRYLVLPALTLGLAGAAYYTRLARTAMLDELHHDYVRTARAKGLGERQVVWRHAFRNALPTLMTQAGLDFGFYLGGVVVIEKVFDWPGIGWLAVRAIGSEDLPVMVGTVLFATTFIVLANLAVDVAYVFANPRLSHAHR